MRYDADDIALHLRLGEDSRWEFKAIQFADSVVKAPRREDLADELTAFANGKGGVLLCGVTDAGRVQGMTRPQMDALERVIIEIAHDSIRPPLILETLRREVSGKTLLAVVVDRGYAVHEAQGRAYRRHGSSKEVDDQR